MRSQLMKYPKSGTLAPIVAAFQPKFIVKPKSTPATVERQLFSQIIGTDAPGKSKRGCPSGVHTRKIDSQGPLVMPTGGTRASDPLINYQRMVGVIDQSSGVTQQDVNEQLLCKGYKFVKDIEWPFDNVAVISLHDPARQSRFSFNDRGPLSRVLDTPWSAKKSLKRVKRLGFFDTLEWDAFVTQAAHQLPWGGNPVADSSTVVMNAHQSDL